MKDYVLKNKKGLLLVLIGILVTGLIEFKNYHKHDILTQSFSYAVIENSEMKEITPEEKRINIINANQEKIAFYAHTFRIDLKTLNDLLKTDLVLDEDNFDENLINYLFNLEKENKKLFNNEIVNSKPSKEYMIALINYFTTIYPDVDFAISAAIAQIESGYASKYMLKCNNIFGGMSSGKLIKYKTIEYGILKYIKLLNDGYFHKGLTTVEAIGRKYNPVLTENGKIASPTWVANVSKAIPKYQDMPVMKELDAVIALQSEGEIVE